MTCIVALKHEGRAYLGADSCYTTDSLERCRILQPKLFRPYEDGSVVIGITGSTGLHTIIRYGVDWSGLDALRGSLSLWVEKYALSAIRTAYQSACSEVSDTEYSGSFLIATKGRIWEVSIRNNAADEIGPDGYTAVGSGWREAVGALYVLSTDQLVSPEAKVTRALQAAAYHRVDCAPPFEFAEV